MDNETLLELIHDLFENLNENPGYLTKTDYNEFLERYSIEEQNKIKELMRRLLEFNHIDERREEFIVNYGYNSYKKFKHKIL